MRETPAFRPINDIAPTRARHRSRPLATQSPASGKANQAAPRLAIEYVAIESLSLTAKSLRKHSEKHIAACMGSLRAFGLIVPIIVDGNNAVIDGHALVQGAERLGFTEIPVVRLTHLPPALLKACRIALNKLSEGAEWDTDALRVELLEIAPTLAEYEVDVEALGFSTAEFDIIALAPLTPEAENLNEAIEPLAVATTRQGDLWVLDQHKLLCGNALSPEDFARLMDGKKARMAFCDPPYNLKVDGVISGLGKVKHREFAMGAGEMSRPEFIDFLTCYMRNCAAHAVDGAVHFACMDWRHVLELITAGEAAFSKFLNLVVWNKTNAGMGTMYRSQHELIGVFKSGTSAHRNNFGLGETGRYRSNVWTVAGANAFGKNRADDLASHPTVKPTPLVMDAILDVSGRGEIVLDCFCGSGTTILAAEKTGRICYAIELDPLYVDVAIRRWQTLTGKSAVMAGTGQTFEEVLNERASVEGHNDAP